MDLAFEDGRWIAMNDTASRCDGTWERDIMIDMVIVMQCRSIMKRMFMCFNYTIH